MGPVESSSAKKLLEQTAELSRKAEGFARKALAEVKTGFVPKVELAMADSARLLGRLEEARSRVRRAQALTDQLDGDDWYIATLVDARDANTDFCTYERQLRDASNENASAIGISLLLARCYQNSNR